MKHPALLPLLVALPMVFGCGADAKRGETAPVERDSPPREAPPDAGSDPAACGGELRTAGSVLVQVTTVSRACPLDPLEADGSGREDALRYLDQGMEAYADSDNDAARKLLGNALHVCLRCGCGSAVEAKLLFDNGIVALHGLGDPEQTDACFAAALCVDGRRLPDPRYSSPQTESAYRRAKERVEQDRRCSFLFR
jgi:hypothetical protein